MIDEKANLCCGCKLCCNLCPTQAIDIRNYKVLNYRPHVDYDKCIRCGKCIKNCPFISFSSKSNNLSIAYAAQSKKIDDFAGSSSGGIASSLMLYALKNNYLVYSTFFHNGQFCIRHIDDLKCLRMASGSKYVYSNPALVYKEIADKHLATFAQNDTKDFFVFMRNTNNYMNGAYKVQDLTMEDFSNICDYFNTRLGTFAPSGSSAQGSLTNSSYAQLLYPAFYKACLYSPTIMAGENLHTSYSKGNWYVPSVEEMRILVANRILSTTTSSNVSQSAADWDSVSYTGKGLFTDANKGKFVGFLTGLGTGLSSNSKTYSYMTSDVADSPGGNIVYGESGYSYQTIYYRWLGCYSWSSAQYNSVVSDTDHQNCRRDFSYTMPLCCEITVTKES